MRIPARLRKWMAIGSGVGIEIAGPPGAESLRIAAVRVRPGGSRLLGTLAVDDAQHHAAGTWGAEYSRFIRRFGLGHVRATVLLPRRDVTIRQIALPGVADKDLPSAIEFQLEGLHSYPEQDAVSSWARIPGTSSVLIAIARRSVVERFTNLFSEAGIPVGCFTCSAAAIHSARHLFRPQPAPVIAYEETGSGVEIYGESPSHPVFSAAFPVEPPRAVPGSSEETGTGSEEHSPVASLSANLHGELRLEPDVPIQPLRDVVGAEPALAYAAALMAACPGLALSLNLLPPELRRSSSRAMWIPVGALGAVVLLLAGAVAAFPGFENGRYQRSLTAEIARVTPAANRSVALDRQIESTRRRILLLDEIRGRSKADLDVLGEVTRLLPPPDWANLLEITRVQVTIAGEAPQAAPLLQVLDASPLFEGSEFASPPARAAGGEVFRIRARREAGR
ncbi:MAG TPA: PilN domain-containing protein [Bryobacteraceae bacterium]|nr:PilN domain-containing protein [Bryobacteraceae bacterium]